MNVDFTPLAPDAVEYLSNSTGIEFRHCNFAEPQWGCVTVRDDAGALMGVWVCEFKTHFDAHCTCAIASPRCMTLRLMKAVFTALFKQAVRLTVMIRPNNTRSLSIARRMGFQYEGRMRLAIEGKHDALVFGMLKGDCRFLMGRPDHGEYSKAA